MQTSAFPTRTVVPSQLRKGDVITSRDGQVWDRVIATPQAHPTDSDLINVLLEDENGPVAYLRSDPVHIAAGVVCGNCSTKGPDGISVQHPTAADVRDCFVLRYAVDEEEPYETCHHGMNATLCLDPYGPHHFGTREWEIAMGF